MSPRTRTPLVAALVAALGLVDGASAVPISLTGADAYARGVASTVYDEYGVIQGPGGVIGSSLNELGVDFGYGRAESYYWDIAPSTENSDGFASFCGVGSANACDFKTGVDGRIVLEGTSRGGLTRFFEIEAGFFDVESSPWLTVFGRDGKELDSVQGQRLVSDTGQEIYAPLVFTVLREEADIAYFDFGFDDGDDYQGFGVSRISIETPTAVPVPGTLGLMGLGLLAVGALRRRKPS